MDLFMIFMGWLHLLSTVIWVGGIIFVLYIAIPSSRQVSGPDAGRLMGEMSGRFTPFANYSILLLVVTGVVLSWSKGYCQVVSAFDGVKAFAVALKYSLAVMMIVVHFYRGLLLAPKIAVAEPTRKATLQKLSLNLVKVNLFTGVLILLLSVLMRH